MQPEHVYTEVERTKRMSVIVDLKKNRTLNGNASNDDMSEKSTGSNSSSMKLPSRTNERNMDSSENVSTSQTTVMIIFMEIHNEGVSGGSSH